MQSHVHEAAAEKASTDTSSDTPSYLGADGELPDKAADRRRLCVAVVSAYGGDAYRLLMDLAHLLTASVAYVDRSTVEAHLERPLSDTDWSAIASPVHRDDLRRAHRGRRDDPHRLDRRRLAPSRATRAHPRQQPATDRTPAPAPAMTTTRLLELCLHRRLRKCAARP